MGRPHPQTARCPPPATHSLRSHHEPLPRHVPIRSPTATLEPVRILRPPAVPDFGPPEDPLDDHEGMFTFRPDLRLRTIPGSLLLTQWPMPMCLRLDETLGLGGLVPDHVTVPTLRRVAPHPRLLTMQPLR